MTEFICIGHRGACGYEPENTLSSFEKAIELGCPFVELDVYAVEDELLVIHDDSLERTTNGSGDVMDHNLAYLRSLDAGNGQQIPTLQEVANLVAGRAGINVELKGPNTAAPVCELLEKLCEAQWSEDQFLISSFYHDELAKTERRWRRGALFHKTTDYFSRADSLGAYAINLSRRIVDSEAVVEAHNKGLKVFVYTVNETQDINRMLEMDVDGVFSDYPDKVFEAVRAWK